MSVPAPEQARRLDAPLTRIAVFLNTFGYIGYFPFASGTVGAAAGLALHLALARLESPFVHVAAILVLFPLGVWSGTVVEAYFGTSDPGQGVIDEVVGMLIAAFLLPQSWAVLIAAFLLFRLFDIIKPYPASRLEYLAGGMGMMADDAVAGLYANLLVWAAVWLNPGWML